MSVLLTCFESPYLGFVTAPGLRGARTNFRKNLCESDPKVRSTLGDRELRSLEIR